MPNSLKVRADPYKFIVDTTFIYYWSQTYMTYGNIIFFFFCIKYGIAYNFFLKFVNDNLFSLKTFQFLKIFFISLSLQIDHSIILGVFNWIFFIVDHILQTYVRWPYFMGVSFGKKCMGDLPR